VYFPAGAIPRLRGFGRNSEVYLEGKFLPGTAAAGDAFRATGVHITRPAPPLEALRTGIRIGLSDRFAPHDWGGLALALLLGTRDNLDGDLAEAYRRAGCAPVLALSGMHLAIVSSVIAFLLKKPLGLRGAAVGGALFIILYVFLVGAQPSLERAAIMYLLGTLAVLGALPKKTLPILALAFLIQLILEPASGDSLSFILSYLGLGGMLLGGLIIRDLCRGTLPDFLAQPLSASLGAFIATAPVVAACFGSLRPVGILAGLAVIPLTTLFMILAMAYLALSLVLPPLALLLGKGLAVLYRLLGFLVEFAGKAPGIEVSQGGLVLGVSLLVLAALFLIWRGQWGPSARRKALAPFAAA
jgi:competence protein ComEC